MDYPLSFLPKLCPRFAARYQPVASHPQHCHLRSVWLDFVWRDFEHVKLFGSTSMLQVHRSSSQYPWKSAEGGIESQSQIHSQYQKQEQTWKNITKLFHWHQQVSVITGSSVVLRYYFIGFLLLFPLPLLKHIFFPLYCTVGLYPWRFTVMRRSRQRSKALLALKRLFLASDQVRQAPIHPSYSNSVSKLFTQPFWSLFPFRLYMAHRILWFYLLKHGTEFFTSTSDGSYISNLRLQTSVVFSVLLNVFQGQISLSCFTNQ